jgi:hypothetical protein
MKTLLVLVMLAPLSAAAQNRPTLAAAVGAGVDLEPARDVAGRGTVTSTLGSYEFEGEIQWQEVGLLARGVGTNGSIDYHNVGFDRLELVAGGSFRPLAKHMPGSGWGAIVARRLAVEAGLAYQRIVAALDDANTLGIHIGAHADFPLVAREFGAVPMIRVILQRSFIIAGDTVTNTAFGSAPIDPGTPALQMLFALGVSW